MKLFEKLNFIDKISLYLLAKWIQLFIISCVGLYSLATLGDIVNNLLRNKLTFIQIIEQNLLNSAVILENVLPVSCLMASLFLINALKQHSELIAILACGYSMFKMALTCLFFGLCISSMQFINVGFWGPFLVSQKKEWLPSTNKNENAAIISQNKIWIKHKSYFGHYRVFDHSTNTMIEPNLFFYNSQFKPAKFVQAKTATYRGETSWEFFNVTITENLEKNQFPLVSKVDHLVLPLFESPGTISEFEADLKSLNVISLFRFLNHIKDTGINLIPYYLQVYDTIAQALLCIIFTLFPFAFPMGVSSRHQSTGRALLYGLIVSVSFLAINLMVVKFLILIKIPPILSTLIFPVLSLVFLYKKLLPKVTL